MKIKRKQLKRIIRESQWQNNYDSWIAQRDRERSDQPVDPRKMRDMGYNDAMSGKYMNKKYMNQTDYASGYQQGLDDIDDDWNKTGSGPDRSIYEGKNKMKISKKQLQKIIKEESIRLFEYEQYVDEDGNVYDDEGNVSRRGSSFGRRYGGQTYTGTRTPWSGRRRSYNYAGAPKNAGQIAAVKAVLDVKEDKFLKSILQQLEAGKTLSEKQKKIVRKIITKIAKDSGMDSAEAIKLFENFNKISKQQLKRIIREEVAILKESDQDVVGYVHRALEAHWKKKNRGFMRNRKFTMSADQVMDALWIDDVWQDDIDELEKIIARSSGSLEELSAEVAIWLAQIRKGGYSTPESREKEMATWSKA